MSLSPEYGVLFCHFAHKLACVLHTGYLCVLMMVSDQGVQHGWTLQMWSSVKHMPLYDVFVSSLLINGHNGH